MKKTLLTYLFIVICLSLFAEKWNFVVYGDNRPTFTEQPYTHYKVVEAMEKVDPEMIFSTGDIIMGRSNNLEELRKMYTDFEEVIEPLKDIPFYVAPGNHEDIYKKNAEDEFIKRYNNLYQVIEKDNAVIILLDSEEIGKKHKIVGEQLEWLEDTLEKYKDKEHKFALLHQPLYPKISHIGNSLDKYPEERDNLAELLKEYKVDMTFVGHVHIFNYSVFDGLHQMITGGGGAPLYSDSENGGFYHFINVVVDGKNVEYNVVRVESETHKAETYWSEKDYKTSLMYCKKAMDYLPNHPEPYLLAALNYNDLQNKEKFAENFQKLVGIMGSEFAVYKRLGFLYYYSERYEVAEGFFKSALAIDRKKEVVYRIAKLNEKMGRYSKALELYEEAYKLIENKRWKDYVQNKIEKMKEKVK